MRRTTPLWIRGVLLLNLPLIAWVIYQQGQHYDPALMESSRPAAHRGGGAAYLPMRVGNLVRMASVKRFPPDRLYEYVNGHAEYYLGAGFRDLVVGEYLLEGAGDQPVVVVDLFDLGEPLNAFGVLMDEGGGTGEALAVGELGFRTGNGIRFMVGGRYVRLAIFAGQGEAESALPLQLAKAIVHGIGPPSDRASLQFRFPELGTVAGTRFIRENYRGYPFLHRVVERSFTTAAGESVQAFLMAVPPGKMAELTGALTGFFQKEGIPVTEQHQGERRFLTIADPYEGEWVVMLLASSWVGVFHPLDEVLKGQLMAFADPGGKDHGP